MTVKRMTGASQRISGIAALVVFLVHLVGNPHYGFFRDELYFIICGQHPQFGYVDQPPIVPLLAAVTQIFGHSLVLLRVVPALFAAGGVYVTCALVVEFGGGAFAQAVAALVFFFTPVLLSFGMKVGTDEVGLLSWPLMALLVVRIVRGASPKLWLAIGIVAGLSFESKYSVVFFLAALCAGLMCSAERRVLFNRWFVGGVLCATFIALPNAVWQLYYHLPMLELLQNGQNGKNLIASPPQYLLQELLITNPLLALEWVVGLVLVLGSTRFRFIGIAYIVLMIEMLMLHGKHYYPANVYPLLIAAGAVAIESWTARWALSRVLVIAYTIVAGSVMVPDALPILPEDAFVKYAAQRDRIVHVSSQATETEPGREDNLLPSDWADMHGWPEMAAAASSAYRALAPAERRVAVVFAGNYGEASAVRFFTPNVPVISEHNQYWLWGPRAYTGKVVVQINGSCFRSDKLFASRTRVAVLKNRYAIRAEDNIPIWICRNPKQSLSRLWPHIKTYE